LADPLEEQLTQQGLKFKKEDASIFQLDMEALDRLRVRGLLVDSQADKVRQKLHKKIVAHIAKCEKLRVKK
jgi:hypothetical protein